jgi:hypothetical protein
MTLNDVFDRFVVPCKCCVLECLLWDTELICAVLWNIKYVKEREKAIHGDNSAN